MNQVKKTKYGICECGYTNKYNKHSCDKYKLGKLPYYNYVKKCQLIYKYKNSENKAQYVYVRYKKIGLEEGIKRILAKIEELKI